MEIKSRESKQELRKRILNLRAKISPEQEEAMNRAIYKKVISIPCFQSADTVYCYMDCRHEAGTRAIINYFWSRDIKVVVPLVKGKDMDFYYISSMEDLETGTYGILEPKPCCLKAERTAAPVIVPGVAFTRDGRRLGYGGGYYDRFFAREPEHRKIGIAFEFQMVEEIGTDPYDIGVDYVVTPDCRAGFR